MKLLVWVYSNRDRSCRPRAKRNLTISLELEKELVESPRTNILDVLTHRLKSLVTAMMFLTGLNR